MPLVQRPYRDARDFEAMQALISRQWLERRPLVSCTVGDIEWWGINDPEETPEDLVTLWLDGEELVGWVWLEPPDGADWLATPAATADVVAGTLDARGLTRLWARDDDEIALSVLHERGFEPDGRAFHGWIRPLPAGGGPEVPALPLPPGYRHASTRWPDDLAERVEVHRSAFAPSRMTTEKYAAIRERRHYAPERDRVIVAPDFSFAAFANAWWDPVARVGELEPVGVHADHRGRGLGKAVCFEALRGLAELGAEECLIFSSPTNLGSEALYASLGATVRIVNRRYARSVAG
jgi:predicted N-acetyltransferase YhbS